MKEIDGYVVWTNDKVSRKFALDGQLEDLLADLRRRNAAIIKPIEFGWTDGKKWHFVNYYNEPVANALSSFV